MSTRPGAQGLSRSGLRVSLPAESDMWGAHSSRGASRLQGFGATSDIDPYERHGDVADSICFWIVRATPDSPPPQTP
jgi:hypothetical protein